MKVAIVGSRRYPNLEQVEEYVYSLPEDTIVVSGGAQGVDRTAEWAARKRGMKVIVIRPDWDFYGRKAGFVRNAQIVDAADRVVAFWDGKSRGTQNTMKHAEHMVRPLIVFTA